MKDNALQIAARGINQIGRGRKCFIGDARELMSIVGTFAEPLSDLMGDRAAEVGMIENRGR